MSTYLFTFDYSIIQKQVTLYQDETKEYNAGETNFIMKRMHGETLRFLILLYVKQLQKYFDQASLQSYYLRNGELPPFKTYATSLHKACRMASKSTFYDHRDRLLNTGAILRVEHDESVKHQLWYINPLFILLPERENSVKSFVSKLWKERKEIEKKAAERVNGSISVPIQTKNSILGTIIVSQVDNVDKSISREDIRCAPHPENNTGNITRNTTGNTKKVGEILLSEQQKNAKNSDVDVEEKTRNQVAPARLAKGAASADDTDEKEAARRANFPPLILQLVTEFWNYAKLKLYTGLHFSEEEEKQIKNQIYFSYFDLRKYQRSHDGWFEHYQNLCKQADIARRTIDKNGYLLPDPKYYFSPPDPDKEREFKFYHTYNMLAKQTYGHIQLELRRWQRNQGRLKEHSAAKLMQRHFGKLAQIGHPQYMHYFQTKLQYCYVKKL